MSPIVGYHASRECCRSSIATDGLIPSLPARGQVFGVYVFRGDGSFDHPCINSRTVWECHRVLDLWECAYIGPLMPDRFVLNAMVFLGEVQHVTLVTGN